MAALTKRSLDAAKPATKEYFLWCSATPGFGAQIYPSGKKVFIGQVRVGRATRRVKIGLYGPYTVDQARRRAEKSAAQLQEGAILSERRRTASGNYRFRDVRSVFGSCPSELGHHSFWEAEANYDPCNDEGRIARHIKPLIGNLRARDVSRSDVQRMADSIAQGKPLACLPAKRGARRWLPAGRALPPAL